MWELNVIYKNHGQYREPRLLTIISDTLDINLQQGMFLIKSKNSIYYLNKDEIISISKTTYHKPNELEE